MSQRLKDERELLSPPGDTIMESLAHYKITTHELAIALGLEITKMQDVLSGKDPITPEIAIALEQILGPPAEFWLLRETHYRVKLEKIEKQEAREAKRTAPFRFIYDAVKRFISR